MKRPRIAVLEAIAHPGGAQISLLELVRRLDGDPEMVVIIPEEGPLRQQAVDAGAAVRLLQWPAGLLGVGERSGLRTPSGIMRAMLASTGVLGVAGRLSALLNELRADMLITNGIKPHIIGTLAQVGSSRPLIWYLRDGLEGRAVSAFAMRALGWRCAGAIAISRHVEQETRAVLPPSVPVRVIYNIIDFDRFRSDLEPAHDLKKANDEVWFGTVGALTPLKGQDLFLQAAEVIAKLLPQSQFLVVGSNFYRTEATSRFQDELRRLADAPALVGRVKFLGQRNDVASVLQHIDILVQPNRGPEALGRSVLEAMACGVPVIVTNKWGPAELVRDGQTGVWTPHLDVRALAANMLALGRDAERRAALGAAAAAWVRKALEPAHLVGDFRTFIQGLRMS